MEQKLKAENTSDSNNAAYKNQIRFPYEPCLRKVTKNKKCSGTPKSPAAFTNHQPRSAYLPKKQNAWLYPNDWTFKSINTILIFKYFFKMNLF